MKYVLAVLALGVLIIVHELGHFIMAKVNKVKVIEFTIGMGPKIFTYQGKETKYCLSLFPVGGYVQMLGQGEESDDEASFTQKSAFRRFTIVIAGVVMNFILAIILFTACICHSGYITNDITGREFFIRTTPLPFDRLNPRIEMSGYKNVVYDNSPEGGSTILVADEYNITAFSSNMLKNNITAKTNYNVNSTAYSYNYGTTQTAYSGFEGV